MDHRKKTFTHRVRHHVKRVFGQVTYSAQVCDAWCREARMYDRVLPLSFLSGILLFLLYFITIAPPLSFPSASLFKVGEGETGAQVAADLKAKHIIHSTLLFTAIQRLYGNQAKLIAGEYFFPGPENVFTVASRLIEGDHELTPIRITVAEGATSKDIALELSQKIPDFDATTFLKIAQPKEGVLFPDTYFFMPGEEAQLVLKAFENNFNQHMQAPAVAGAISAFGKPLPQVITMASLLEKEAPDTQDREIISGILWKRIKLGMPLQVDAVFPYIIGVNSLQLTKSQLQTNSPYNTYTNKGLPPGPIANPSLDSIMAAVQPTKTNYLYYLSDLHGVMHFCATYACQQANQAKYLGS